MAIFPILLVLCSFYFQALRAQKGPYEVAVPVCNSRGLSDSEAESFNDIIRLANSSFPCSSGNDKCCKNELDDNLHIAYNPQANLLEVRTPSSRRPGRIGNLNIVTIIRCARPGEICKISPNKCTDEEIIQNFFTYLEPERILCAWDQSMDSSSIGCMIYDALKSQTFPRKERCDPHIGSGIRQLQEFLGTPDPMPTSKIPNKKLNPTGSAEALQSSMPAAQASPTLPLPLSSASPTKTPEPANCFPGHAIVQISEKREMRMDALRVGDVVRVSNRATSPVFAFSHRDEHMLAQFVRLRTVSSRTLMLTPGHLVYLEGRRLVPAERVLPGHKLILANGQLDQVQSTELTAGKGVYNPQTLHGDIIVDGFIVSTYTTSVPQSAAHAMLAPVRASFSTFGFRFRSLENDRISLMAFLRNNIGS